jgi:hypothetical protein
VLVTLPNPIPELQHAPLPLSSVESQRACPDSLLSVVFYLGFTFESLKELGVRHLMLPFVALMLGFSIMRENPMLFSIVVLLALSIIIERSHKTTFFTSTTLKAKSLT